ncbi:GNAT family N-acetyltransferase [Rhizorhapis sp. SPR117]|uniref:GNAT family N-acetyltransferase n=1 Tax=Rhizorhapis sp. SPR117 TaxID=2912611 RepID=UPI001F4357B7|nr:GNAT family N-acetyltransferase [Rhizorhapis sp. SPR117]
MWVKGEYHDDFTNVRKVSREGLSRESQPHLFDRVDWLENLYKHCLSGYPPLFLRARAEGAEGWLFLYHRRTGEYHALANWYNFSFRPVFSGNHDEKIRRALLKAMARRLRGRAAHIVLYPVVDEDGAVDSLLSAFRAAGWAAFAQPVDRNHFLDLEGRDFDSYWSARPGAVRSTVDRKLAKFPLELEIHDRFSPEIWEEYEAVYENSWKPEEGSLSFLRAIAEHEGQAGHLRIGIARSEGVAVAAQFWTVENGAALIHKLAHREDAGAGSPGTLLSYAMFRHVIDVDKVERIDFGTGDDAYKRDWMEDERPLYRIDLYNLRRPSSWFPALKAFISGLVRSRKT